MPSWRSAGLLAFTVNFQGGSPQGYSSEQPWHNSAFEADGRLRPDYAARMGRIIERADAGIDERLGRADAVIDQRLGRVDAEAARTVERLAQDFVRKRDCGSHLDETPARRLRRDACRSVPRIAARTAGSRRADRAANGH